MAVYQIGKSFRVAVGKEKGGYPRSRQFAVFRCECGETFIARCRKDMTTSCGCFVRKVVGERSKNQSYSTTHGMSETATYRTWCHMKDRCENPNDKRYAAYGGRGITMCDRWRSFENFLNDMGERPNGKSIDRIDNNKGYCKENCRWANRIQQARNTRRNILLTIDGEVATIAEWCQRQKSVTYEGIRARLNRGWSHKEAVFGRSK